MKLRILFTILIALSVAADAAPDFIPKPSQAYEGFVALNPPRADVPIGALWIDGYGPTGEPAAAANLETVRSLNGLTIDRILQINLSAGLFDLIGIDPRLRDQYSARFTDLSIVRVRDVGGLSGAPGEPRILEALKAGSVTVSTNGEIGLNGRTIGFEARDVDGTGTTGRTRLRIIEGRDLFVAVRIAKLDRVTAKEKTIKLSRVGPGLATVDVDTYRIFVKQNCNPANDSMLKCDDASVAVQKLSTHHAIAAPVFQPLISGAVTLTLPVPRSDERGGLYSHIIVRLPENCRTSHLAGCWQFTVQYAGERLQDLPRAHAKGWR